MRTGPNGKRYANYDAQDRHNLTRCRGWDRLGLLRFELTAEQRAGRVEAYRLQVALAGQIVQWLPPPANGRRCSRQAFSLRSGRQ